MERNWNKPPVAAPSGRVALTGLPAAAPTAPDPVDTTARVTRGVRRALAARGHATVAEFALRNGRRADVMAVDAKGTITIVEVKSSVADFRADRKWREYRAYCDCFYFAVPDGFPVELIPDECGLMVADAYEALVARDAPLEPLNAARRKSLLLRFCLTAAGRLHRLEDPGHY